MSLLGGAVWVVWPYFKASRGREVIKSVGAQLVLLIIFFSLHNRVIEASTRAEDSF